MSYQGLSESLTDALSHVETARPHVIIIGGGFGGLTAAQSLAKAPVRVTVLDRTNHHLFQPLLYQVATAGLSPAEIASPIRSVLRRQQNTNVLMADVTDIDLDEHVVMTHEPDLPALRYDFLILATGAETNYFGNDSWGKYALGLKSLPDALEIRERVLLSFEVAERERDKAERERLMSFVVIGGGPTGVEMAGALSELARFALANDFRSINPRTAQIFLIEAGDRILPSFAPELSDSAIRQLEELHVHVRTHARVTDIDKLGVHLGDELIPASVVIWAAGVKATPLTARMGVPIDRAGRILVEPDCSIPGHPNAFAIGDTAAYLHQDGKPLPGVSPVAMQQARYVARNIVHTLQGREFDEQFHYHDKGSMATIGRSRAIAEIGKLKLKGFVAWWAWLVVHLVFLVGFRNRIGVFFDWIYSYFTYYRGVRLITGHLGNIPQAEATRKVKEESVKQGSGAAGAG